MGGSSRTTTTSGTNTRAIDPAVSKLQQSNYDRALGLANTGSANYGGNLTASFDGTPMADAVKSAQGVANFHTPTSVSADQIAGYMNPYQSSVIDATTDQLSRQNNI